MILLADDYLLFQLPGGESVPVGPEMIRFEVPEGQDSVLNAETINQAAAAVFHYFKHELRRSSITMAEFTLALEKVLRELERAAQVSTHASAPQAAQLEADLCKLADAVDGVELLFFSKLRQALRAQVRKSPATLHFRGLRRCVKRLSGARRWSGRCQALSDQIVAYMRSCLQADARERPCTLLVE